ncbi:uncharacterized protein LOC133174612 [Saccostrea echinata]|uniref:uncharacterized protein LOC133174612 n=1 Tax=Saccostrea echinata TaxID=191078 RepID=UPI002A8353A0|nr:uncharacterized protein LOC133174612 [Saccostrea echinata]
MDHIPRLSEILYIGLCRKIGTPTEVTIRRNVWDMLYILDQNRHTYKHECIGRSILSGSQREGFRFDTSDQDYMMWCCGWKVIKDISQSRAYNSSLCDIILMEDTNTPPGFVRLQLLTVPRGKYFTTAIIPFNDRIYISSFLWRQVFADEIRFENVTEHGPCSRYYIGDTEVDRVFCFASKYWPSITEHWIKRCVKQMWPPAAVLKDILNNDIHCVPIGSKCNSSENDLEWRLSFSLAEQKLVFNMNHTQFLCYGLLKIFLKEVINNNVEEPLLCSYFMKTTMFWLIQVGHLNWRPNNLLECFWMCFKYLILCVYRCKFANFFIPQNNMFSYKIVGVARESLLEQLNQYYRIGVACLLHSPTLRSILVPALSRPSLVIPSNRGHIQDIVDIDKSIMNEILDKLVIKEGYSFTYLKSVDMLQHSIISPYMSLTLQYCKANYLVNTAFTAAYSSFYLKNKYVKYLDKMLCNMLKLSSRIGSISHSLYLALYYYRTGRYYKALNITNLTKQRLSKPYILYKGIVDRYRYSEDVSSLSLSKKMNFAWVAELTLYHRIRYIEELTLEQQMDKLMSGSGFKGSFYSPFVIVHMLSVLSNYRLGNRFRYLQSLQDLRTLLLYDDGRYISLFQRDMSWQILGICQQVVGDLQGALQSYQESLRQEPFHRIQTATKARIDNIRQQLSENIYVHV